MEGRMEECMNGWMEEYINDEGMEECVNGGEMYKCMNGWINEGMDGGNDKCVNGWMNV